MIQRTALAIALTLAPAAFAQTSILPNADCGAITLRAAPAAPVANARVILPKQRVAVTPVAANGALEFEANVPDTGVVMAAIDFKPVVNGDETRTDHAKSFIFCGAVAPQADWQLSANLGLEIYPQGWNGPRPKMKAGDPMRFIVDEEGEPRLLPGIPLELDRLGTGRVASGVSDQNGWVTFRYPEPGWYTLTATYRRPDPRRAQQWLVDTSTLTFEIK